MTTLAEIQDAISQLTDREQTALAVWLDSRRTSGLNIQDEESLLRSLDEATKDINAGKGVSIEEVFRKGTTIGPQLSAGGHKSGDIFSFVPDGTCGSW